MRSSLATGALVMVLVAVSGGAQQDAPRFRRQVDLIAIDVSALDSAGRPVVDLRPGDFVVKVDGAVRPVVSAEVIRVDPKSPSPSRADARISSNAQAPNARRVMIAVDQSLIVPGANRPVLDTASRFVDRLPAADYAAYIALPPPGPRVDFTTDKSRVRKAMEQIVGNPQIDTFSEFVIGLSEAVDLTAGGLGSRTLPDAATPEQLLQALHPIMRDILEGGCEGMTLEELVQNRETLQRCMSMVFTEALRIVSAARVDADRLRQALENLLEGLVPVEGPKTLVMISGGLMNDDPSLLDGVTRLAAAARTTIHVVVVEPQRERGLQTNLRPRAAVSPIDRAIELQGLELLADRTGGDVYRSVAGTSEGVFQRIESQISAWYLLAVERRTGDPERQRVEVATTRRGVSVRSHKTFTSPEAIAARRSTDERLSNALSSPIPITQIPMRVATFAQRDAAPGEYRVRLAVEVGRPGERAGEFAVGYALMDQKGELVTSAGSQRSLSPAAGESNPPLRFDTALSARPGTYSLRVGVLDSSGRVGTVVHPITLPSLDDEATVTTSDLIVGHLPADGGALSPTVEPRIDSSEVAGYLELYVPDADRDRVTVRLEIAEGEASPALAAAPLTLRAGNGPGTFVATGTVGATTTPGRYVARATVRRDKEVVATLIRPIEIVRDPTAPAPPRLRGVAMSLDLRRRTASYVSGVINGLANVVAQEDFSFTNPKRRVTSDLLLVRYPGSNRDLIPFRDVSLIDGAPVSGREARILDLFSTPTEGTRERARRITLSSDAYVPTVFNPMFVIGFLQADFQSGFELTVSDAGREWPREVKAVTFVETRRPTLLRAGPFGDQDAPTRGTAWIEEGTGRILQTELQVGQARSAPRMTTRFKLDDRLQVMVPETMRTENPSATVTYINFRRFNVETKSSLPAALPK